MIGLKKSTPERQARRFFLKKKWGRAIEECQKCLSQDDRNLGIVNLLGDAYFQKKDADEAFEYYRKAMSSFEAEGLHDNAIAIAKKISRLDPANSSVQLKLAQLYTDQEFLADALAHLNSYLRLAGKKIDDKVVRTLFQKMAGITVHNPKLWDEIGALYRKFGIDDPDLTTALSPDRAEQKHGASKAKGEAVLVKSDEMDTIETLADDELDTSGSEAAEPYADQMITRMENIIRESAASEVNPQAASGEKAIQLTNILSEILPSDETLTSEPPSRHAAPADRTPPGIGGKRTEPSIVRDSVKSAAAYMPDETIPTDKLIVDALGPIHEAAEGEEPSLIDDSGRLEPTTEHSVHTEEAHRPEEQIAPTPQVREEPEVTAPTVSVEVEEPKPSKDKLHGDRVGEESDVFWTLPYEVAEETATGAKDDSKAGEDQTENLAVETMLTGFSAAQTQGEENPPTQPAPYGATESAPESPTAEHQVPVQSDIRTDQAGAEVSSVSKDDVVKEESDTAQEAKKDAGEPVKKNLQSLELSEVAAMNRDERLVGASFDGKEHYDMGKIYKEMRLWDAAIAEFKTAATDPNWRAKSCIVLAECFKEKGDVALAISQLKWALSAADELKDESDAYDLHYVLGQIYERGGNLNEAKEEYQAVHRWNPSHKGVEKKLMDLRKRMQKS